MSILRTAARAAFLAVPLGLAGAQAWGQTANYDFYLAGIKVGTMAFTTRESARDYSAGAEINASGLVAAVLTFTFDGSARGGIAKSGAPVPSVFEAVSDSPKGKRTTRIDWKNGVPVAVTIEPPRDNQPAPGDQAGTLDPISAGFALLRDGPAERMCATSVDVFDGSRRSRLKLGERRPAQGGFTCSGTYARVQGEPHSLSSQTEFPFTLTFSRDANGMARTQRIQTSTSFGKATLERRS
jgi:hypothetical protein